MIRIKDDKKEIDKDMIIIRNFIDFLTSCKRQNDHVTWLPLKK